MDAVRGGGQPEQEPDNRAGNQSGGGPALALGAFFAAAFDDGHSGKSLRHNEEEGETPQQEYAPCAREEIQREGDEDDQEARNVELVEREGGGSLFKLSRKAKVEWRK